MNIPQLKTSQEWAAEASAFLARHTRNDSFDYKAQSTFNSMMEMAKLGNQQRYAEMFPKDSAEEASHRRWAGYDAATRAFFSRTKAREPMTSASGTIYESNDNSGRLLLGTQRSYAGLDTSTSGDAGGFNVPFSFLESVITRAKAYDGLLDAARYIYTDSGAPLNIPTGDDTSQDAVIINEASPVQQGPNPIFGNVAFGSCPLWSTAQLLTSWSLTQDSPVLADFLSFAFGRRIARGFGKACLTTLLSGVDVGKSTASPTAVTVDELIDLASALDAEYWARASWLMNLKTYLALRKLQSTNHYFIGENAALTDSGRPTLLQRPIYICPNLDDLGPGKTPILLGALDHVVIRAVNRQQEIFRYDQLFFTSHTSIGWQGFWRLDSAFVKAGTTSDKPVVSLRMPLS
jgi:HK97 family phage major capsid protein